MSLFADAVSLLPGSLAASTHPGLGAPAEAIDPASPLVSLGLQEGVDYYWTVASPPASGVLVLQEDGGFSLTGTAVGSWPWQANVYANGVLLRVLTVVDGVGLVEGGVLGGAVVLDGAAPGGGIASRTLTDADVDAVASAVWSKVIESGLPAEAMLRIALAALAGKANGIGTAAENYIGLDGTTTRVAAQFDAQGNRTVVAVDGS